MKEAFVHTKRVTLAVMAIGVACIFGVAGCAQEPQTDLDLPEGETRQLAEMDRTVETAAREVAAAPAGEFKQFRVYVDQGYFKNHFIPSGWMGDVGDIGFSDACTVEPQSRRTCIKITYSAERKQGAGWAGVYWQDPANNWGSMKGGYDLTGAKKLTFWARGDKGGEVVTEFKMGGLAGEYSDTASSAIGPVVLTKDWRQYTIDLEGEDLSNVIGGFAVILSSMENPQGATIYLDNIIYE